MFHSVSMAMTRAGDASEPLILRGRATKKTRSVLKRSRFVKFSISVTSGLINKICWSHLVTIANPL